MLRARSEGRNGLCCSDEVIAIRSITTEGVEPFCCQAREGVEMITSVVGGEMRPCVNGVARRTTYVFPFPQAQCVSCRMITGRPASPDSSARTCFASCGPSADACDSSGIWCRITFPSTGGRMRDACAKTEAISKSSRRCAREGCVSSIC